MLQEVEQQVSSTWEGYVDWRNKPALRARHGGMVAASFVLGNFPFLHRYIPKFNIYADY